MENSKLPGDQLNPECSKSNIGIKIFAKKLYKSYKELVTLKLV